MFRFFRPDVPEGFEVRVASARKAIADAIAEGKPLKDEHFPDLWSTYKQQFFKAQHRKCGYCEAKLGETGDMEHYQPKNGLAVLPEDDSLWGREIHDGTNVEGRRPTWISDVGYHWLAYTWTNYLVSCERCNRPWKGNLFPVAEANRAVPPTEDTPETPLLLSPYEGEEPTAHLAFDRRGQIRPRNGSSHGWETIRTCGLDRESLRDRREDKARRTYQLVREYARARGSDRDLARARLQDWGQPSAEFAGMVRSIVELETRCRWSQLFPELSG